jgi:hypothetical protein
MKDRTSHEMFSHTSALRLAERIARRTGERQRVELIPSRVFWLRAMWRVRPVEAPATDAYDPVTYANEVRP